MTPPPASEAAGAVTPAGGTNHKRPLDKNQGDKEADKSAAENRWVRFDEVVQSVYCKGPQECALVAESDVFPEGFRPSTGKAKDLLLPEYDEKKKIGGESFLDKLKSMFSS